MILDELFEGKLPPGVYNLNTPIDYSTLASQCEGNGLTLFIFDGTKITNKQEFFDQWVEMLNVHPSELDSVWDRDWDSFEEMISTTKWIESNGTVVVYKDYEHFKRDSERDFDILVDILNTVTNYDSERGKRKPIHVFFNRDGVTTCLKSIRL